MGHKEAKTAEKKQTKKVEKVQRTELEILKDISLNLHAHLSVTPEDVMFLLNKYNLALKKIAELETKLNVAEQGLKDAMFENESEHEGTDFFRETNSQTASRKPDGPPSPPPNVPFKKGA